MKLLKKSLPKSFRYPFWEEFTKTGKVSNFRNPLVHSSWQRCLDLNIKPSELNISPKTAEKQRRNLLQKNRLLLNSSFPALSVLENSFRNMTYAVLLSDKEGNIIYKSGSGLVSDCFDQANLVAGGNCSEKVIGTTAPGIALVEKKPAIVLQEEHYSEIYHRFCCSAFPIFDLEQRLYGCLNFTILHDQSDRINFLQGFNIATVKSIQSSLHTHQLLGKLGDTLEIVESSANLAKKNILIIDKNGKVLLVNQNASDLLAIPAYKLIGEHYREVLESDAIVVCFASRKKAQAAAKLKQQYSSSNRYIVQANPLFNKQGEFIGSVAILDRATKKWQGSSHKKGCEAAFTFQTLIGKSDAMRRSIQLAKKFATSNEPILLYGDTGTGKEVFAQAIHNQSRRRQGPFVPVNCAAIPHDLVESELFGYKKGAFTGALKAGKQGKFESAEGGTLFLDEINSMPKDVQGKLLRAVESGEIIRLGGHTYKRVDVRIISASGSDLSQEAVKGHFRKDLFYRLGLVRISLPLLKDRKEDILSLVHYFLEKSAAQNRTKKLHIHPLALERIMSFDWPGNIRELGNCIKFAAHLAETDEILFEHLPDYLIDHIPEKEDLAQPKDFKTIERSLLIDALESANGHIGKAAKNLGISRSTIYRKRKQYGL